MTTSIKPDPMTVAHLDAMTATGAEGWLVVSAPVPTGDGKARWHSCSFTTDQVDEAATFAAMLDHEGHNVYVRTSLLNRPLASVLERGKAVDTGALVALVVDLDHQGPGHAARPAGQLPLPAADVALDLVRTLPPPSLTIATGGGHHLWWLLDEPVVDDPVAVADRWADGIVALVEQQGYHLDRPDVSRVLRIAGTHRRKPGIEPNRVQVVGITGEPAGGMARRPWCPTGRYSPAELLELLPVPAVREEHRDTTFFSDRDPLGKRISPTPGKVGPADVIAAWPWSKILEPAGFTFVGHGTIDGSTVELWRRPGADVGSDYSLKAFPDGPAVAWSDSCGLPTGRGQRLSKFRAFACIYFHGDEVDAGRTIRRRALELAR